MFSGLRTFVFRYMLVGAALAGPALSGAVPRRYFTAYTLSVCVVLTALFFLSRHGRTLTARHLTFSIGVFGLGLGCADLLLRLVLGPALYYRPHDRYFEFFPALPLLYRYTPSVSYDGTAYGDLAAMSGDARFRQYRQERFVTDRFGFRNDAGEHGDSARALDAVVLGDSFGVGNGTSQDHTWPTILQARFGVTLYNLSMPGGPWHEFVNLAIESPRLRTRRGTVILWALFPGNDLEDPYHVTDLKELPWKGTVGRVRVSFHNFRRHSPVGQMVDRLSYSTERPLVIPRTLGNGRTTLFFEDYARRKNRTPEDVLTHPNFESLRATFHAMVNLAKSKHFVLAVVIVTSKEEVYAWALDEGGPWSTNRAPSGFARVMKEMCEQEGIPFLDLKPFLVDASKVTFEQSGELLWWHDDTHWNPLGHEVVASVVYERVLKSLIKNAAR